MTVSAYFPSAGSCNKPDLYLPVHYCIFYLSVLTPLQQAPVIKLPDLYLPKHYCIFYLHTRLPGSNVINNEPHNGNKAIDRDIKLKRDTRLMGTVHATFIQCQSIARCWGNNGHVVCMTVLTISFLSKQVILPFTLWPSFNNSGPIPYHSAICIERMIVVSMSLNGTYSNIE